MDFFVLILISLNFFYTLLQALSASSARGISVEGPGYSTSQRHGWTDDVVQRREVPSWQWYIDVDSKTHQRNVEKWSADGFRMISISVYGSPSDARYAAVWVQRTGPDFLTLHDSNRTNFRKWIDEKKDQGYIPTLLAVTGPRNSSLHAGVIEKISDVRWTQACDMDFSEMIVSTNANVDVNLYPNAFRQYGTANDPRYCAIWHANAENDRFTWAFQQTAADYNNTREAQMTKPYFHPEYLSTSEDQKISSLYTDSYVGKWAASTSLSSGELKSKIDEKSKEGLYLFNLQGFGNGNDARFSAIWAEFGSATRRVWTNTGQSAGIGATQVAEVDEMMKRFMQATGARQAQMAASKNGTLFLDRAYTWSEAPYRPTTSTSDTFLLASVSKLFCSAAIQTLYDSGELSPTAKAYDVLGMSSPNDTRADSITIAQLVNHTAGYDNQVGDKYDPAFNMRTIAQRQSNGTRPATMQDVVDYMYQHRALDFDPGARYAYSNYGYLLLSRVVEYVTGRDYYDYLQDKVFGSCQGSHCDEIRRWATSASSHQNDSVIQESRLSGLSALEPRKFAIVPCVYGGDGMYKESGYGVASLAASARMIVQFVENHASWGIGGRRYGSRWGSMEGVSTWVESQPDRIDWAVTVNTRSWPNGHEDDFLTLVNSTIPAWLEDVKFEGELT
ncbi:MAG: hypothetical protein M1825_002493 [Sarcosagium campestre]|nr:MAG: hypothetical protein M1825_002493 [Sarcosagium campestre]